MSAVWPQGSDALYELTLDILPDYPATSALFSALTMANEMSFSQA